MIHCDSGDEGFKPDVFWAVISHSLVGVYKNVGGTSKLHLQNKGWWQQIALKCQ
jgi:hypothetical protein